MLVSFAFRLEMHCPACRMSIPVNGIVSSIACYHCGERHALDAARWRAAISRDRLSEAYSDGGPQELSRPNEFELAYRTWNARCEPCKGRDIDLIAVGAAVAEGAMTVPCPDCARPVAVRAAGELACAIDPYATLVVGETAVAPNANDAKQRPVVFTCEACNAALAVDGTTRLVACQFCEASNYLPDGLWRQLNPVPKVVQWFLVADYDKDALRELCWRKHGTRFAAAMSTTTVAEELALLAADGSQEIRLAVAKNAATPPAVLERLVGDLDERVAQAAKR